MIGTTVSVDSPTLSEGPAHPEPRPLTAVWVLLDAICPRDPGAPRRMVANGLDMDRRVPGILSAWYKTVRGDWLGLVTFSVPYADEHRKKLHLTNQLVPAYAIRPRMPPGNQAVRRF